jgi:uncharacterized protein involved in outer membrane biogenesis
VKKLAFAVIGLLAVLVAVVLIAPGFINWNVYKTQIVAAVQDTIRRTAAIDGDVSFTVLPAPELRVTGVRIANFDGADTPDMLQLKELRLRLSVGALLEGRIAVEQLELIEPVLVLEAGADGKASWIIDDATGATGATGATEAAGATDSSSERSAAIDISLAGVTIRNGSVRYRATGQDTAQVIKRVNMAISAPSLAGPFRITADARYRKTPFSLMIKTSTLTPGQPVGLNLKLSLIEAAAAIEFTGRVTTAGTGAQISGRVKFTGDSAARLASLVRDAPLPAFLHRPVTLEGALTASSKMVSLNDARFQFGDESGTGAVNITLGDAISADIAVSLNHLDLDALLAQSTGLKPANAAPAKAALPTGAAPQAAFVLPAEITLSLDLGIEAIEYRGGVIRQARIRGSLANGAVTLDRASALLPGGSDISLVGFLQAMDGEPLFEGDIAAASDNLRGMLRWLGVDTAALPADRLRGFSFASKLTVTPGAVQFPDINLRLDASTATGGLAVALRERPGFGLRLDIDRLNLDAYLPKPARESIETNAKALAASPATATAPRAKAALAFLDRFDANIDARIGRLTIRRAVARKVAFTGQLVGGVLSIEKFGVADVAGARFDVWGMVGGFAATPSLSVDYDVAIDRPEQLLRYLDIPIPVAVATFGKPTITGSVSGTASAFELSANIAALGGTFGFDGALDLAGGAPSLMAAITLNHPELVDFIRQLAPEFNPATAKLGELKASFKINGGPANVKISALEVMAGPVTLKGSVALRNDGPRPVITARLTTSDVLLDLFLRVPKATRAATARGRLRANGAGANGAPPGRWSTAPLEWSALQGFDADVQLSMSGLIAGRIRLANPDVSMILESGQLTVKQFRAELFGGAVSGNALLDAGGSALSATLSARNIDMATIATAFGSEGRVTGTLVIDASLTSSGTTQAALIAALNGKGRIGGKTQILPTKREQRGLKTLGIAAALFGDKVKALGQAGGLSGLLLDAFGRTPAEMSGDFTIARGILRTTNATLAGAGARALGTGTIDLPRWLIDMTASVLRSGDTAQNPYVSLRFTGPPDAPNIATGATRDPLAKQTDPKNMGRSIFKNLVK